jgi:hypothetical protein
VAVKSLADCTRRSCPGDPRHQFLDRKSGNGRTPPPVHLPRVAAADGDAEEREVLGPVAAARLAEVAAGPPQAVAAEPGAGRVAPRAVGCLPPPRRPQLLSVRAAHACCPAAASLSCAWCLAGEVAETLPERRNLPCANDLPDVFYRAHGKGHSLPCAYTTPHGSDKRTVQISLPCVAP